MELWLQVTLHAIWILYTDWQQNRTIRQFWSKREAKHLDSNVDNSSIMLILMMTITTPSGRGELPADAAFASQAVVT